MPAIVDHVTVGTNYDRRRRLSDDDREDIKRDHAAGDSIHAIARCYGVSRRLVQFILYPERHEENKVRRRARGGSRAYYDKNKHTNAMRDHRAYKKELYNKGLVKRKDDLNGFF